jgi:hypothetical protein
LQLLTATDGYFILEQKGKLSQQGFGWAKLIGTMRQSMGSCLSLKKVEHVLTMAAYSLTRMRTLEKNRLQST